MSAQLRSRALEEGRVKALRRMKQPMTLVLETSPGARDPVARALDYWQKTSSVIPTRESLMK